MRDSSAKPAITAAICTHQRYDMLHAAIRSLTRQSLPGTGYNIIVVDNSPDAEQSRVAHTDWAATENLTWIHDPVPGLSRARNTALAAATTPLIAFLDDDATAGPDWLHAYLQAFTELGPDTPVIGGRVNLVFVTDPPAWLRGHLLAYLSRCDLGAQTRHLHPREWVVGANIAYRTAAATAAGGFNTALGRLGAGTPLISGEEADLEARLHANGGKTGYAPHATVDHFVPDDRLTPEWFRRRIAWQAVTDFIAAPATAHARAQASWQFLRDFFRDRPATEWPLHPLAEHPADDRQVARQFAAIQHLMTALLSGDQAAP